MDCDVAVIGAGPAGSVASALLRAKGYHVRVFEKQHFPRFSIGESLLPQCMEFLEKAGMLSAVQAAGFQHKEGAAFTRAGAYCDFDFRENFSGGWGTTYQVPRGEFDLILANCASAAGADIAYGVTITGINFSSGHPQLQTQNENGDSESIDTRFVFDASGFGRVLSRLLNLEVPSDFPVRSSLFTHVKDRAPAGTFDRNKILVCIHPDFQDVWFWLIPFSNGRCSVGVVAPESRLGELPADDLTKNLKWWLGSEPKLASVLANADFDTPVRQISGYACNVTSLWGEGFALLGNAGEFLDPVFSSGVTIAIKSADLAVTVFDRGLRGEEVDWEQEFAVPLKRGVDTFRTFVEAWYDGRFQDIIFSDHQSPSIRGMICAVLAGYAWDLNNPYAKESERRINTLAEICRAG